MKKSKSKLYLYLYKYFSFFCRMPTCVVIGCNTGSGRGEDEKWQTEKLPKCEELKQKWLNQINRKDYEPTSNTRICFKHFHEEDFVPIAHNR